MAHIVICPKCKQKFDKDKCSYVIPSARRYGHPECYPNLEVTKVKQAPPPTKTDLDLLKDYISELYRDKANWPLIIKQIKTFKDKGYSYTGMLSTLKYFYEIQHNSVDDTKGGIGIIDYAWADAKLYYYKIWIAQQKNENVAFTNEIKEVYIALPHKQKRIKLMDMDWEEAEEDE